MKCWRKVNQLPKDQFLKFEGFYFQKKLKAVIHTCKRLNRLKSVNSDIDSMLSTLIGCKNLDTGLEITQLDVFLLFSKAFIRKM